MLFESWLLPYGPLQTRPQGKHRASTAPSAPPKLMSIPLVPKATSVFSANPPFWGLFLFFFFFSEGREEKSFALSLWCKEMPKAGFHKQE